MKERNLGEVSLQAFVKLVRNQKWFNYITKKLLSDAKAFMVFIKFLVFFYKLKN